MNYISRLLEGQLRQAADHFPALLLTGPRRVGKTTLLRHLFPRAQYYLVEDPDIIAFDQKRNVILVQGMTDRLRFQPGVKSGDLDKLISRVAVFFPG